MEKFRILMSERQKLAAIFLHAAAASYSTEANKERVAVRRRLASLLANKFAITRFFCQLC